LPRIIPLEDAPAAHAPSHEDVGADELDVTGLSGTLADEQDPENHGSDHTDGTDNIQSATAAQDGLATSVQITKLNGIEPLADVTPIGNSDVRILAGSGVLVAADEHITVTATGTLTLPVAPDTGTDITIARRYAGVDYTIDGNGQLLSGAATAVFNANYQSIRIIYDGTEWMVV